MSGLRYCYTAVVISEALLLQHACCCGRLSLFRLSVSQCQAGCRCVREYWRAVDSSPSNFLPGASMVALEVKVALEMTSRHKGAPPGGRHPTTPHGTPICSALPSAPDLFPHGFVRRR